MSNSLGCIVFADDRRRKNLMDLYVEHVPDAVLFDGVHLVCTNLEMLHAFAQNIGLKRSWFQDKGRYAHYDILSKRIARKAIECGAIQCTARDIIRLSKLWNNQSRSA